MINCRVVQAGGVTNVFDSSGNPSKLYNEAVEFFEGDSELALDVFLASQTEDYQDMSAVEPDKSTVEDVLKFLTEQPQTLDETRSLNSKEIAEVTNVMEANGIKSLEGLSTKLNELFKPEGLFEVDTKRLIKSGFYTKEEAENLNESEVFATINKIDKTLNYGVEVDAVESNYTGIRNTSLAKNSLGVHPAVTEAEVVQFVLENGEDALIESQYSFVSQNIAEGITGKVRAKNQPRTKSKMTPEYKEFWNNNYSEEYDKADSDQKQTKINIENKAIENGIQIQPQLLSTTLSDYNVSMVDIAELEEFVGEDREGGQTLKESRSTIEAIKKSILKEGLKEPLILQHNREQGTIVEGNHRYIALKELGFKFAPVSVRQESALPNNVRKEFLKINPSTLAPTASEIGFRAFPLDTFERVAKENNLTPQESKEQVQEVISKLKQTGLAENVFQLSNEEINAKLDEIGVSDQLKKQILSYHGTYAAIQQLQRNFSNREQYGELMDGTYFGDINLAVAFAGYDLFTEQSFGDGKIFKAKIDESTFETIDFEGGTPKGDVQLIEFIGQERYNDILERKRSGEIKGLILNNAQEYVDGVKDLTQYVIFDIDVVNVIDTFREEAIKDIAEINRQVGEQGMELITNGFTYQNSIYLNTSNLNSSTSIHEFAHQFNKTLKKTNPELYNKGLELVRAELDDSNSEIQSTIDYVKQTQPNLEGERLQEEILAQLTGERGIQLLESNKDSGIKEWLKEFWNSVMDMLGLTNMTPRQVSKLNIQGYADAIAVDLLRGENIIKKYSDQDINQYVEELIQSNEVALENEDGMPCAKNGIAFNGVKFGGKWRVSKDLKGMPSHRKGGVDVILGDKGVTISRGGNPNIKAENGLALGFGNGVSRNNAKTGSKWTIAKDLKGRRHSEGGIDIVIGDEGIKVHSGDGSDYFALKGLLIAGDPVETKEQEERRVRKQKIADERFEFSNKKFDRKDFKQVFKGDEIYEKLYQQRLETLNDDQKEVFEDQPIKSMWVVKDNTQGYIDNSFVPVVDKYNYQAPTITPEKEPVYGTLPPPATNVGEKRYVYKNIPKVGSEDYVKYYNVLTNPDNIVRNYIDEDLNRKPNFDTTSSIGKKAVWDKFEGRFIPVEELTNLGLTSVSSRRGREHSLQPIEGQETPLLVTPAGEKEAILKQDFIEQNKNILSGEDKYKNFEVDRAKPLEKYADGGVISGVKGNYPEEYSHGGTHGRGEKKEENPFLLTQDEIDELQGGNARKTTLPYDPYQAVSDTYNNNANKRDLEAAIQRDKKVIEQRGELTQRIKQSSPELTRRQTEQRADIIEHEQSLPQETAEELTPEMKAERYELRNISDISSFSDVLQADMDVMSNPIDSFSYMMDNRVKMPLGLTEYKDLQSRGLIPQDEVSSNAMMKAAAVGSYIIPVVGQIAEAKDIYTSGKDFLRDPSLENAAWLGSSVVGAGALWKNQAKTISSGLKNTYKTSSKALKEAPEVVKDVKNLNKVEANTLGNLKNELTKGSKKVVSSGKNVTQAGFGSVNPIKIADKIVPTLNPIGFVDKGSPFFLSPLNKVPFYGKKLKGDNMAFRKFGNDLSHVKSTKTLSPSGGGFRIGKSQIKEEGNWAEIGETNEKYTGVFESTFDFNNPKTKLGMKSIGNREGVLITNADGTTNTAVSLSDPGVSLNRRLPFSNRYVPINKQKVLENKFQLVTQLPHVQSLIEKYGIGVGWVAAASILSGNSDLIKDYLNLPKKAAQDIYEKLENGLFILEKEQKKDTPVKEEKKESRSDGTK